MKPASIEVLHEEVKSRFGVLPNFFRLTKEPQILASLWGFARFAYLDNPLPSLFKERLFVYVSRFCEVRYCIARHVGFLAGLGRASGDAASGSQTLDEIVALIRRPLPRGAELEAVLAQCEAGNTPLADLPAPGTSLEEVLFACATHVFLQSPEANRCSRALDVLLGESRIEYLTVFLAFVRTAHFWTKTHEDLRIDEDVAALLATNEILAQCVLTEPGSSDIVLSAYETLRLADQRKTEFLAMLAHELRNPLAAIRNAAGVLMQTQGNPDTVRAASDILERQVSHMVRQVDDLLDISRISQGKITLRVEPVDLATVVQHAVDAMRSQFDALQQELHVKLPVEPIVVNGDAIRLGQLVGNLLNNACKFTGAGGRIWLVVERDAADAVLRIRDNGIGIAADQLDRVFELFAQVSSPVENARSGLGIGLTLVRTLVELHGGTVQARSLGVGQGSEFTIRLALVSEAAVLAPEVIPLKMARGRRILVVDDNKDSADSLAMLLQLTGHQVYTAHGGLEAINAAATLQLDLILLDIGMPGVNGYEAARRIKQQRAPHKPMLVALSGWSQFEDRRLSQEAGFDFHLAKPVDMVVLAELLVHAGGSRELLS